MNGINVVAALLAAMSSFLLGGAWYSLFFAKQWQKLTGLKDEELRAGTGKVFAGAFVLSLVMAFNLAAFIGKNQSVSFGAFAGFAAGFGWVAMSLGINYLFERKPIGLFLINGGYNVVALTTMGIIVGAMH